MFLLPRRLTVLTWSFLSRIAKLVSVHLLRFTHLIGIHRLDQIDFYLFLLLNICYRYQRWIVVSSDWNQLLLSDLDLDYCCRIWISVVIGLDWIRLD